MPTGGVDERGVGTFQGSAVGFGGIENNLSGVTDGICDEVCEFEDRDILAGADVNPIWGGF